MGCNYYLAQQINMVALNDFAGMLFICLTSATMYTETPTTWYRTSQLLNGLNYDW